MAGKYSIVSPDKKINLVDDENETANTSVGTQVAYTAECFMNAAKSLHKLHLKIHLIAPLLLVNEKQDLLLHILVTHKFNKI